MPYRYQVRRTATTHKRGVRKWAVVDTHRDDTWVDFVVRKDDAQASANELNDEWAAEQRESE
jgi:hypothetical protein